MQIVINKCFGGFGLSPKAQKRYAELKGIELFFYQQTKWEYKDGIDEYTRITDVNQNDPFVQAVTGDLGETVESLGNNYWFDGNISRDDITLVQVVKEMKKDANGPFANLRIIDIPDGIKWEIDDYDGMESIHESHQSWG